MNKSIGAKNVVYPNPSIVAGTYDKKVNPNVMTAAKRGICCTLV